MCTMHMFRFDVYQGPLHQSISNSTKSVHPTSRTACQPLIRPPGHDSKSINYARKTNEVGDGEAATSPSAAGVSAGASAGGASAGGASAGGASAGAVSIGGAAASGAVVSAGAVAFPAAGASAGGASAGGGAPPAPSSGGAGVKAAWSRAIFPAMPPTDSPPSVLFSVAWEFFAYSATCWALALFAMSY